MSEFTGALSVTFYEDVANDTGRAARLNEPLIWHCDWEGSAWVVEVPTGFMTDGSTVPWFLWWFLPPWGDRSTRAAILHDYLRGRIDANDPHPAAPTWVDVDRQYYLALVATKVDKVRARLAWLGVRAFSIWYVWKGEPAKSTGEKP